MNTHIDETTIPSNEDDTVTAVPRYMPIYSEENVELWLTALDKWLDRMHITNDFVKYSIVAAAPDDIITVQLHENAIELADGTRYEYAVRTLPVIVRENGTMDASTFASIASTSNANNANEQNGSSNSTNDNQASTATDEIRPSATVLPMPPSPNSNIETANAKRSTIEIVAVAPNDTLFREMQQTFSNEIAELRAQINAMQPMQAPQQNESATVQPAQAQQRNENDIATRSIDDMTPNELRTLIRENDAFKRHLHRNNIQTERTLAQEIARANAIHVPCWFHATYGPSAKKCRPPCSQRINLPPRSPPLL